jgi:hypothetical protein
MMIQGKQQINLFRMRTLLSGLRLEATTGMRLTNRGSSCYTIIKKEYGLKGNKTSVYNQFVNIYNSEVDKYSKEQQGE